MRLSAVIIFGSDGTPLVIKDFRRDASHIDICEIFNARNGPIYRIADAHVVSLLRCGLIICGVTLDNVSPAWAVHLLERVSDTIAAFFGFSLDEVLLNHVGICELLDEMIEFGYVTSTDVQELHNRVFTEKQVFVPPLGGQSLVQSSSNHRTVPTLAINRPPILCARDVVMCRQNELYVDIRERLTQLLSRQGVVERSEISGKIVAEQRLGDKAHVELELNRNVHIVSANEKTSYGSVKLHDVILHEGVYSRRLHENILAVTLSPGLHSILDYAVHDDFRLPFRLLPRTEPGQFDIVLRADFPAGNRADDIVVSFSTPFNVSAVPEVDSCPDNISKAIFRAKDNRVVWKISRMVGGSVLKLRCRIRPKAMAFQVKQLEITYPCPQNVSNLHIRSLRLGTYHEYKDDVPDELRQGHRRYSKRLSVA